MSFFRLSFFRRPVAAGILMVSVGLALGCSQRTLDLLGRSFIPMHLNTQQVTASTYHQVILPGYRTFTQRTEALNRAISELSQAPAPETLATAQQAWSEASKAWVLTEAYQFGPATEERLRQNISFWPRRTEHITGVLAGSTPIQISQLGTTRKGLPVIEYLLFHTQAEVLNSGQNARHLVYLKALSEDLVDQAQVLQTAWEGDYAQAYLSSANAQNMQLNQWVVLLENMKNKRLGEPAGLLGGTATGTEALEAPDSTLSLSLLRAALEGFSQSYALEGLQVQASTPDTAEYLVALGHREVHQQILAQIQVVEQSLTGLEPSLEETLKANPEAVANSFESIKTLLRLVKVDLANALNQTVNFTDNDGD